MSLDVVVAVASGDACALVFAAALHGSAFTTALEDEVPAGLVVCVVDFVAEVLCFVLCAAGFFGAGVVAGALVGVFVSMVVVVVALGTGVVLGWAKSADDKPVAAKVALRNRIDLRMTISRLALQEQNAPDGVWSHVPA